MVRTSKDQRDDCDNNQCDITCDAPTNETKQDPLVDRHRSAGWYQSQNDAAPCVMGRRVFSCRSGSRCDMCLRFRGRWRNQTRQRLHAGSLPACCSCRTPESHSRGIISDSVRPDRANVQSMTVHSDRRLAAALLGFSTLSCWIALPEIRWPAVSLPPGDSAAQSVTRSHQTDA